MRDRVKIRNFLNPQPDWYTIKNVSDEETEIFIYDEISFFGVTARQFTTDLGAIGSRNITVRLNSPGGDVFDGIAIYNALRSHPAYITTKVDSLAASIASVIAQAGDKRLIMPKGQMMIHEAQGAMVGNSEELRKFSDLLDKQSELIASIYAERSEAKADFRELMKTETWLSDAEVIDLGLADEIAELPNKTENSSKLILLNQETNTSAPIDWLQFMRNQEVLSVEGLL